MGFRFYSLKVFFAVLILGLLNQSCSPSTPTPTQTPTAVATATASPTATPDHNGPVFYVSPDGDDANPGTKENPWKTIKAGVGFAKAGDTISVLAGDYPELVFIDKSGIRIVAEGKAKTRGFSVSGDNNLISGFIIANPTSDFGVKVTGNNNVIEKNDISDTLQDGIWFFGSGNLFTRNHIHDIVDRSKTSADPHVDCFQTWGPAQDIVFEKNFCDHTSVYGSNQIIMLENKNPPVRNIVFRNNIFVMHDGGYSPMNFNRKNGQSEISNIRVVNNTIVNLAGSGEFGIQFVNITGAVAVNNAFVGYGNMDSPYIAVENGSDIQIGNNAVFKLDGVAPMGGPFPNDVWMKDPMLMNFANFDFHLTASSPLIDGGANLSEWAMDDYDGNPRPFGSGYDIGAFEYIAAASKLLESIAVGFNINVFDRPFAINSFSP